MPKVQMFTTPGCGPCAMVKPKLQNLSETRGFELEVIQASPETVELFKQHDIRTAPTVICINDDGTVHPRRIVGNTPALGLLMQVQDWGL